MNAYRGPRTWRAPTIPLAGHAGRCRPRRILVCFRALVLIAAWAWLVPTPALVAQPPTKLPRVGFLTPATCPDDPATPVTFLEGLRGLGYVPGRTIVLECRVSDGTNASYQRLAAELVRLDVDAIFAESSSAVRAARAATTTIPVVALDLETDPVAAGLAASLARPGGNVTGIFLDLPELSGKRLQLLREALPRLSRVAILWDVTMDPAPLAAMERAAQSLGVQARVARVRAASDFEPALAAAVRERAGAIIAIESPMMDLHRKQLVELALRKRLPAMGLFPSFVEDGGLLSYGPNVADLFGQVPSFIDKVLKGAKPGDLPIHRPTRFYMALNLKTASVLRLSLTPSFVGRADQVIK